MCADTRVPDQVNLVDCLCCLPNTCWCVCVLFWIQLRIMLMLCGHIKIRAHMKINYGIIHVHLLTLLFLQEMCVLLLLLLLVWSLNFNWLNNNGIKLIIIVIKCMTCPNSQQHTCITHKFAYALASNTHVYIYIFMVVMILPNDMPVHIYKNMCA